MDTEQDRLQAVLGKAETLTPGLPAWKENVASVGGGLIDMLMGAIGVGKETKPNLLGQLLSAGLPITAGVKGARGIGKARKLTGGFYSRLDEAAQMLPKKGVPAPAVMNWLKKSPEGISPEEASYRKLDQFLSARGGETVTPEMLAQHLADNPAPFPKVKTMGGATDSEPQLMQGHRLERLSAEDADALGATAGDWQVVDAAGDDVGPSIPGHFNERQAVAAFASDAEAIGITDIPGVQRGPTKFSQYQVPGGENYRETLLTLPNNAPEDYKLIGDRARELAESAGDRWDDLGPNGRSRYLDRAVKATGGDFRSSHFPDDPNLLVHTRSNDRTLPTGERGRFVEEVQSDWHQKGAKEGYREEQESALSKLVQQRDSAKENRARIIEAGEARGLSYIDASSVDEAIAADVAAIEAQKEINRLGVSNPGVPDAPFKDTWPDLGLKQQLIETANDPSAEFLGFTGGKTQAARYDLSKQISRVALEDGHGSKPFVLSAFDLDGKRVLQQAIESEREAADHIGKEVAAKLWKQSPQDSYRAGESFNAYPSPGVRELSGLDLQVGGEGMHAFYDEKLPKRLGKIVKPFGGTVEQGAVSPNPVRNWPDTAQGRAMAMTEDPAVPMWFSRLTPEMKDAIKRGVPLMSVLGTAGMHQLALQMKLGEPQ